MKTSVKRLSGREWAGIALLLAALAASVLVFAQSISARQAALERHQWLATGTTQQTGVLDLSQLECAVTALQKPILSGTAGIGLFAGEVRVVAIGSAYPIPYDAEACPFTATPQPEMNQLDRDGDGLTDDWEVKYGLDRHDASDGQLDLDGDGFSNFEEFKYGTDPLVQKAHPSHATKLRLVRLKVVPFPLVFNGASELSDGRMVFQINTPADGKTHFSALGEEIEGIVIKRFMPSSSAGGESLVVMRGDMETTLPRGVQISDPESQAEMINMLDQRPIVATMGALLSLRDDEYTVLGVYPDRVRLQSRNTGEVVEVVGCAKGGSEGPAGGSK